MKLNTTISLFTLLSLSTCYAHAAQELTPERAAELKPFERITIVGRFNTISDAVKAVSRRADKSGADFFYVQDSNSASNSGNWRVVADLYHKDSAKNSNESEYRIIEGLKELPKAEALRLEPYDTVTIRGFYRSQPDVNSAIAKAAKKKGADAFFIVRQVDVNQSGNQAITAYIYTADAPVRQVQSPDLIPADSEAGRALLAAGGDQAAKVEIPGVASSASPSRAIGRFFETQSTQGQRYTVTLPDGTKIQELNKTTAAQMTAFASVTVSGHFGSMTHASHEVAKRAAAKGAKYYHITRQRQNNSGNNTTIYVDLFK
ncbi:DUF1471 family protein YdgH [Serratia microhaemolytica]|uniref:DUF1471 family protein YdgH n=1 Tax=Serratia microhaemolytica TaxID=2675110 RepID=UPI000FDE3046|nr:DUF1471 family protein YdgH [Serratia microhaemolytica]